MSFNDSEIHFFNKIAEQTALTLDKVLRYEHYKILSFTDELTGVYNRRYFMQRFDIEEQRSLRYKRPFAVFMLNIDHFKTYNDKNGHINGETTRINI